MVLVAIVGYIGSLFGVVSLDSNTTMTDNKNEQKYYEKLDSVVAKYQKSCGITIDKNYIHTILVYPMSNYDEFFGQDFSLEDIGSSSEDVDYKSITGQVDTVAKLLVKNCSIDYDVDGSSYNRILESSFFKKHYKETLKKADAETILEDVFNLAEVGSSLNDNAWFINDNLKVTMGTCEQPYNKKLLNEGSNYNSTVGFSDYVMGVVMGEVEGLIKRENIEFLKAFTIVASSYALGRSGYESGDEEIWVHNGNCWQLSCDIKQGCTYCYDLGKYGTTFTGQNRSCNNLGYRKDAMNDTQRQLMNEVFKEVFGTVMLETSGKIKKPSYRDKSTTCGSNECLGQEDAALDARNGMSYKEILEKYYDNFTLSNMQEDAYAADVSYDDGGYSGSVVYYDQTDYTDKFCGQNTTIKGSGCGVTSMAMVLSTFVDKTYTPKVVMQEAYAGNYCGGSIVGTAVTFFKYSAQKHGLSYQAVSKTGDKQDVIDALKSGNSLVIAHMGPGTFTNSGHYIVLTKVNDNGEVYVLDSNNSRRTGWHDFNGVVAKQLKSYGSFHIITKR